MRHFHLTIAAALAAAALPCRAYDVCIYGGTASAAIAATSASRMGMDVVMVSPDVQVGGMTSGGLGLTDIGNKQAVTGLARQFYRKVGAHYGTFEQWVFEPHVAEGILEDYIKGVKVLREYRLASVSKDGTDIRSIRVFKGTDTLEIAAQTFIDCTYEGDLMAKAGVSYRVGREANSEYGEQYDGVQLMTRHQFPDGIDPYKVKGDPASGLLWGISDAELQMDGTADTMVQAYNFRICLTDDPDNRIPITRPEGYDSTRYELLLRLFDAQPDKRVLNNYFIWSHMPCRKTDINNRGGFSTDMIGMNHSYPEASYEGRDSIIAAHTVYTKGLLYFYLTDPRVPAELREEMSRWGYPRDEYLKTGHWTPQLYVREVRRMVGEYVATQKDCDGKAEITDGIGYAAYQMDSHNCQRIVIEKDGVRMVKNEGNVEISGGLPYPISYRSITPKRGECTNLLVPVCMSASHIAYGSIRMEPVFMALGESAAVAAALSVRGRCPVQKVDVREIQRILAENPYLDGTAPDVVVEDSDSAVRYEGWKNVNGRRGYGPTYLECRHGEDNTLTYTLPKGLKGTYDIYSYQQFADGLNPVMRYEVQVRGRKAGEAVFDMREHKVVGQASGEWFHIGTFKLKGNASAEVKVSVPDSDKPSRADAIIAIKR